MDPLVLFDRQLSLVDDESLLGDNGLYELLGVSSGAGADEIKNAYRNLSRRYHPDKGADDNDDMMRRLNLAKSVLLDQAPYVPRERVLSKRQIYDTVQAARRIFGEGIEFRGEKSTSFADVHERTLLWDRHVAEVKSTEEYIALFKAWKGAEASVQSSKLQCEAYVPGSIWDFPGKREQLISGYKEAYEAYKDATAAINEYLFSRFHPEGKEALESRQKEHSLALGNSIDGFDYASAAANKLFDLVADSGYFRFDLGIGSTESFQSFLESDHLVQAHLGKDNDHQFGSLRYVDLKSYKGNVIVDSDSLSGRIALFSGRVTVNVGSDSSVVYRVPSWSDTRITTPEMKQDGDLYCATDFDTSRKADLEIIVDTGRIDFIRK